MDIKIYNNPVSDRFEAKVESGLCELDYEKVGADTLDYKRTFVPENLRHKGIGHELVKQAMEYAKEKQYHVKLTCPFAKKVVEENKGQFKDVIVWN